MNAVIASTEPTTAPAMIGAVLACLLGDGDEGIVNLVANKLPRRWVEEERLTVALR